MKNWFFSAEEILGVVFFVSREASNLLCNPFFTTVCFHSELCLLEAAREMTCPVTMSAVMRSSPVGLGRGVLFGRDGGEGRGGTVDVSESSSDRTLRF